MMRPPAARLLPPLPCTVQKPSQGPGGPQLLQEQRAETRGTPAPPEASGSRELGPGGPQLPQKPLGAESWGGQSCRFPLLLSTSRRLKEYEEAKSSLKDTSSYPLSLTLHRHRSCGWVPWNTDCWASLQSADSVGLASGPRICISNPFPGNTSGSSGLPETNHR